jgi:hypothetical protein
MPLQWHIDVWSIDCVGGWIDDDGPAGLIEIGVNGRRIAAVAPTNYRKDLEDAGVGDGHRGFGFWIAPYLADAANIVTISYGGQLLHSDKLARPIVETPVVVPMGTAPSLARPPAVMFLQTSDQGDYRRILDLTSRTVVEYCCQHGFTYYYFLGLCRGYRPWQAAFNRITLLKNIVISGFTGWVCYLDADAFIADLDFNLAGYLSDKGHIAFIAATDRPHLAERPYWLVNAGTFMINLATPVGQKIVHDWAEQFNRISDEELREMAEWTFDDQPILQHILEQMPGGAEAIMTLMGEPNLINYSQGIFIRQILRTAGSFEERLRQLREQTDSVLSRQQIDRDRSA